nr:hypothetical protein [Tanacetum cinerariifolium]
EVSDDEEMTQVKVMMALTDEELAIGKNHGRNGERITMRNVNNLLSIDEDANWKLILYLADGGGSERRTTVVTSRIRIMVLIEGFVCVDLKVLVLGLVFELFEVVVVEVGDGYGMKEDEDDYGFMLFPLNVI